MDEKFDFVAKTFFGFEQILEEELLALGADDVVKGNRSVFFKGDRSMLYKVNLASRTSLRILKPIAVFDAVDENEFYKGIKSILWDEHMGLDQTFSIDARIDSKYFKHSHYISLKTKDAIVDQFSQRYGRRPNVDLKNPDIPVNIHIQDKKITVLLDSSGASLHHRGYRTVTNAAPINEVLAAGLLLLSGWKGQSDFLDPMCGSGTICIEAAMIALNLPANMFREKFAFQNWKDFDKVLFRRAYGELMDKQVEFKYKIKGYDILKSSIDKAYNNVENAELEDVIELVNMDFFDTKKANDEPLHILFNPPYDERLSINVEDFYKYIGDTLKTNYTNSKAWFVTANLEALKYVGLRPSRKIKVFNGALEARLVQYEIYEGTRKKKYDEGAQ